MGTQRGRVIVVLALTLVVFAAPYVWAQQASPSQEVASLTGKWVGAMTATAGSSTPVTVEVKPDGSYSSMIGSSQGQGTIKQERGKLIATGHLITGGGAASGGDARSQLTLGTKDGKQTMTGAGRDNYGAFNFVLTKQQ